MAPTEESVSETGGLLAQGPAADEDIEAGLIEALTRLPPAKAAGEVAKRFGADRKAVYARAMALKA